MGLKNYDVVAHTTEDGEIYCLNCSEDLDSPVFANSEWDYQPACDGCHEPIEGVTVINHE